ncbi:uncharacterized protein LOC100679555 [Nasonia vitripennis]|uniref:Uncharacterized protein n=1 Tax=Nasonia vitripennis TaxID=7425 RepID=A0A7M7HD52_NASVI|nr:uncharacterized protein LOC100679555 [Nasonia vitripennis]XP_008216981.1 uncharacterized protein LOC100679555 [Nasonia vitripennis]XP_008216982.1 uncharacterized protein LOC100679555 [Nasonia vitripennis]
MISIKIMVDDFRNKRAIRGKHLIRQDQRVYHRSRTYKKETVVSGISKYDLAQEGSPYYTYNYHHGKLSQMREKRSKDRNEQFDQSRGVDSSKVSYDYYRGSVPAQDKPVNSENNCEFYRRNYLQASKPTCERNENSEQSRNLFLRNSEDRARSFMERSEPRSNGGSILRPPVLPMQPISNDNSLPRIREIVSMSNPVLNGNSAQSAGPTDKASEKRGDEWNSKSRRSGKRVLSRKELARMRMRIAGLSLEPEETTKPTASSSSSSSSSSTPRPSTSSSSTQTPAQPAAVSPQASIIDADYEENIMDIYRCEKCHSLGLPELYECGAGHAVCEECWLCLSRCPGVHENEHNAGGFRRALGLEKLAKFIKFPCLWQENGCQEKLGPDAWRSHATRCRYFVGSTTEDTKVQPTIMDSGLDSDDDVVVILDEDEEYAFKSGEE